MTSKAVFWISLEQEVKAFLSKTVAFVKSASQAASDFSCHFPPIIATICPVKKHQKKKIKQMAAKQCVHAGLPL